MKMDRVDRIIKNEEYIRLYSDIEELESDRIFCHHDMDHFLDVARIGLLMASDDGIPVERDILYAAALLHDIGRGQQYRTGMAHEIASADMAPAILEQCGYGKDEIEEITEAIRQHGNEDIRDERDLKGLLYRADKASRKCFLCKASDKCHKRPEKRVMNIMY